MTPPELPPAVESREPDAREWWHILADDAEAERDAEPDPRERRRSVGHPAETMEGPSDAD